MSNPIFPESLVPAAAFLPSIPKTPQGRYAHIVLVRETESYPIFQTDGTLNIAKVRKGLTEAHADNVIRLTLFKRKQTSPERLVGRELLRRVGITQAEDANGVNYCEYNQHHCQRCPDCVYYGFAIGEEGSEKSKVYVDTAFSVTGYDESHQQFSFNALYEKGNMSQQGTVRSSFGEQDHVIPQVFFPTVVTIKDVTVHSFGYVLNNLLRTKRYGATTTRTGKMENHIVAAIWTDGEVFSNLKLTQKVFDLLAQDGQQGMTPLNRDHVLAATTKAVPLLLPEDGVSVTQQLVGKDLTALLERVRQVTTDSEQLATFLRSCAEECEDYYRRVIEKPSTQRGRGRQKAAAEGDDE